MNTTTTITDDLLSMYNDCEPSVLSASGFVYDPLPTEIARSIVTRAFNVLSDLEHYFYYDMGLKNFISNDYASKWPSNSHVNWWSRPFEYYFCLYNLQTQYLSGKRSFLEIGPGCSITSLILASLFPDIEIVLIDSDETVLSFFRHSFELIGFTNYSCYNSITPALISSCEVVFSVSVIEHIPQPFRELQMIVNSLSPDSCLIATFDVDRSLTPKMGLTRRQIRNLLNSSFAESFTIHNLHSSCTKKLLLSNHRNLLFSGTAPIHDPYSFSKIWLKNLLTPLKLNVFKLCLTKH